MGLLDLTRGELGSRGSAELRDVEAANAAAKMGAAFRRNLGLADGFFQYNQESLLKIIEILRWCQPEIVLINAPDDRHPDHGRSAKLEKDACFYSGLLKIETSFEGEAQQHWRPKAVYHYVQDLALKPDFVVDITDFIEQKIELVLTFRSQFYLTEANEYETEPKTPISGKEFLEFLRSKDRVFGRLMGAEYAEGFIATRTPGITDLFDLR